MVRRLGLEGLAFAANVLLVPSAVIFGALVLMGVVLSVVGTGVDWGNHPAIARIWAWFMPPEGSYTGAAAAAIFAKAGFKASFIVYLVTLPLRLFPGKRFSFQRAALSLLALTIALVVALAVIAFNVEMKGGKASWVLACAFSALAGYVLALPYLFVIGRIDRAIDELAGKPEPPPTA
jgi:hypothetical protein